MVCQRVLIAKCKIKERKWEILAIEYLITQNWEAKQWVYKRMKFSFFMSVCLQIHSFILIGNTFKASITKHINNKIRTHMHRKE